MKIKTKQKGFTLMELIIVLAIFSVIMVIVMNFIDPVSKLMTKASTREKTAAYVDNVSEYVDKSLRYASFVRVFENTYCDKDDSTNLNTEKEAIQSFINDFYDGAIDKDGNPIEGKVHVLKLLNAPDVVASSADPSKTYADLGCKEGAIVDTVYSFKAGDGKPVRDFDTSVTPPVEKPNKTEWSVADGFPPATIGGTTGKPDSDKAVINPEHFEHYSYYYKLGFYEFLPVSNKTITNGDYSAESGAYDASLITNSDGTINRYSNGGSVIPINNPNSSLDFYYSELVDMLDASGSKLTIGEDNFAVTVVAYTNDSKGNSKIDCVKTYTDDTDTPTTIFKSPSFASTISMALPNINPSLIDNVNPNCVMKKQEIDTGDDLSGIEKVKVLSLPFKCYEAEPGLASLENGNIFFIFVVPSEVNN